MTPQEITAITAGTHEISATIGRVLNWRSERVAQEQARKKAALTSLVLAASETRQYLAAVRRDHGNQSLNKEQALSALWANAGMDMMPFDNHIANTYLLKADYWSDPEGWSQAAKDERAIQLDEVYRLGRKTLLGIDE